MKHRKIVAWLLAVFGWTGVPYISAQTVSPAAAPASAETTMTANTKSDETVVLSPFVVTAEEDNGYKATSTLAGTRLRSDLKDIAASISVVTKDFMTDVNATDLTSLLVYTLNTEIGDYGGNYSGISNPGLFGDASGQIGKLTPNNRVRGLAGADMTRDYFASNIPIDSYNVDRVEINRGANAILFGLGSPAGIINTSIITADIHKTKSKVTGSFGSYGSRRVTLDTNQVLIPDKLAVRVATVYNDTKYRVEHTYYMNRGVTATVTYQPFKDTTFRLTHEHGSTNSTKPQIRPPYDWYTWWWAAGKPVWDPTTGTGHLIGTPQAPFTTSTVFNADGTLTPGNYLNGFFGGWRASEIGLIYQDPNSGNLGGVNIGGGQKVDAIEAFTTNDIPDPNNPSTLIDGGMVGLAAGGSVIRNVYQANNPFSSLYTQEPQITDPHVFDFYHYMMGGPSQYEWGEWTNTNLTLDQTFFNRKAGISVSYQKESTDSGYLAPSDYELTMDVNEKLPNGAPNPNFLRPVMPNFGSKDINSNDNEAYRATVYYDLDLSKVGPAWLGKILGHHMIQGNYMAQDTRTESMSGYLAINNEDYVLATNIPDYAWVQDNNTSNWNARLVAMVNYLGPSAANAATPAQAPAQGLTVAQDPTNVQTVNVLYHHNPDTTDPAANTPWTSGSFGLISNGRYSLDNTVGYDTRTDLQVHSLSSAIQSFWFDGTLVSTLGFRTDRVWTFSNGDPPWTISGIRNLNWDVFHPLPNVVAKDSSTTWGLVGHLPQFLEKYLPLGTQLSAFYNHAQNFSVSSTRYNLLGEAIPSQGGTTREYGINITTFNGKLDFKVAHYETVSADNSVTTLGNALNQLNLLAPGVIDHDYMGDNQGNPAGIAQAQNWFNSPEGQIYLNAFHFGFAPNTTKPTATYGQYAMVTGNEAYNISAVSDVKATGYEFEATYNPLKNWRITANASRNEAVRTNIAPEFYNFIFGAGGLVSLVQNPDGTPTAAGNLIGSPLDQPNNDTLKNYVFHNILDQGVVTTFAQEGTASSELRKWNWRLVTDYQFDDRVLGGRLNGFSVGGAVRWQDKEVIGYGGTQIVAGGNSIVVSDVKQPIYGPAEKVFDLWFGYEHKLSHGINWKLQLNIKNVGVGNELIPFQADPTGKVVVWRIKEPQNWTLTNTFEF